MGGFDPIAARRAFDPESATIVPEEQGRQRSYLGDLGAEFQRGAAQAGSSYATAAGLGGADVFDSLASLRRTQREIPQSRNMRELGRVGGGAMETFGYVLDRPSVIPEVLAGSLASYGLTAGPMAMLGGKVGTVAGGALGSAVPGPGTVGGAAIGGATGFAGGTLAGSALLNVSSEYLDLLDANGVDTTNPEQLRAAFSDPEKRGPLLAAAAKYGVPIAVIDAISAGVAGRVARPVAQALRGGRGAAVVGAASELGTQAALGSTGEAAGQLAAGKPFRSGDVLLEGLAEVGTGAAEVAGSAVSRGESVGEAFTGQDRAPRLAPTQPQPVDAAALADAFEQAIEPTETFGGTGVGTPSAPAVPATRGQNTVPAASSEPMTRRDARITPEELFGLDPAPEGASPARRATLLAEAIAKRPDYDDARDAGEVRRTLVDGFGISAKKAEDIVRRVRQRASRGLVATQIDQERAAATDAGLNELLAQVREDVQNERRRTLAEETRQQGQLAIEDRAADPGLAFARQQVESVAPERPQSSEAGLAGFTRKRLEQGGASELTRVGRELEPVAGLRAATPAIQRRDIGAPPGLSVPTPFTPPPPRAPEPPPPPPQQPIERPLSKAKVKSTLVGAIGAEPLVRPTLGKITHIKSERYLNEVSENLRGYEGEQDYLALLARVYAMDKAGDLKREDVGKVLGLDSSQLGVGDSWDIDGRVATITAADNDSITVSLKEPAELLPIGGEMLDVGGESAEYVVPRGRDIPANEGTLRRGVAPARTTAPSRGSVLDRTRTAGVFGQSVGDALTGSQGAIPFTIASRAEQEAQQVSTTGRDAEGQQTFADRLKKKLSPSEQDQLADLEREFADELDSPIEYLGSMGGGVNPKLVEIAFKQARLYVKAGARAFADVASALVETLGEAVRGVLDAVRGRLTNDPSLTETERAALAVDGQAAEGQAPLADTAAPQASGPAPAARSSGLAPAPPRRPAPSGSSQGPRAASRASRPSSDDTALGAVRQNYTAAQREILDGLVQRLGRPELAQLGESLKGRALGRAIDEYLGRPETRPVAEVQAKVDARAATPEGRADIGRRLLDDADQGRIAGDEDTLAYKQETRRLLERAAESESDADMQAAIAAQTAYRAIGTEQGRALAIRREKFDSMEEAAAATIADTLLGGTPADRLRSDSLTRNVSKAREAVVAAQEQGGDVAAAQAALDKAKARLNDANAKQAERTTKIIAQVEAETGFPLRDMLAKDPSAVARMADFRTALAVGHAIAVRQGKLLSFDALFQYRISAMLSAPTTQVVNAVSTFAHSAWQTTAQRLVEAAVNTIVRDPNSAQWVEAQAIFKGLLPGIVRAARNWMLALRFETPVLEAEVSRARVSKGLSRIESRGALGDATLNANLAIPGLTGRIVRGMGLTPLLASDEFNKGFFGSLNAYMFAARQAKREGLKGEALWTRAGELFNDLSSQAWADSVVFAEDSAFQGDPSKLTESFMRFVRDVPGLRQFFPFMRTADRVLAAGLRKAPVTAQIAALHDAANGLLFRWGVRTDGKLEYSRNKAVRGIADNLMSVGILLLIASMMDGDDDRPRITGSTSFNAGRRETQQRTAPPMSIRIGEDTWVSYNRLDPLATVLAQTVDALRAKNAGRSAISGALTSIVRQVQDKTFLKQLSDLVALGVGVARAENDKQAKSEAMEFARGYAVTWIPNIIRATSRATDAAVRDQKLPPDAAFWDQALALKYQSVPLEKFAPPSRVDIWGRPIRKGPFLGSPATDFAYRLLVPAEVRRTDTATGPDRLILAWNAKAPPGAELLPAPMGRTITMPGRGLASGRQVTLDPEQYQRMAQRAGTLAYDALRRMNLNWENPTERDAETVRKVLDMTRDAARKEAVRDLMQQGAAQ